jgi:hypothetical protein
MKTYFLLLLFIFIKINGFGQEDEYNPLVIDVRSPKLFLYIDGATKTYSPEINDRTNELILKDTIRFECKSSQINFFADPVNPLRFTLKYDNEIKNEAPNITALSEAFNSIANNLESTFNINLRGEKEKETNSLNLEYLIQFDIKEIESETPQKGIPNPDKNSSVAILKLFDDDLIYSKELIYLNKIFDSQNATKKKELKHIIIDSSKVYFVEHEINKVDFKKIGKDIMIEYLNLKFGDLEKTRTNFKNINDKVEKQQEKLIAIGDSLDVAVNKKTDSIDYTLIPFIIFLDSYKTRVKSLIQTRKNLLDQLMAVSKKLEEFIDAIETYESKSNSKGLFLVSYLEVKKNKTYNINVKLYERKIFFAENDVLKIEEKEVASRNIVIRRYQTFIPEVVSGIAYTNLTFHRFGTSTDSLGNQLVSDAGDEVLDRINFDAMANFVLNLKNCALLPLLQIGFGPSKNQPVFFTGAGFKFDQSSVAKTIEHIDFSIGAAWTWNKQLSSLKLGDKVGGTADIEKDVVYRFTNKPRLYLGLQVRF